MQKVFITFLLIQTFFTTISAQLSDTLVTISGTMLKAYDSTAVSGNILYEKLPYYDDMGIISVGINGSYHVQLIKGDIYDFSVTKPGFNKYESQIRVNENTVIDIYLEEDVLIIKKLENLNFASGSHKIGASSYQELDELAIWMLDNSSIVIQLEGHTDFAGNAKANLRLSQARVEAIKNYLIEKKVKKNRIYTKAFGGTQPLIQERSDKGKALNRRVEVRVIRK
ncbi:MAG: OmpA family protein [Bacteroidota bacterium]